MYGPAASLLLVLSVLAFLHAALLFANGGKLLFLPMTTPLEVAASIQPFQKFKEIRQEWNGNNFTETAALISDTMMK